MFFRYFLAVCSGILLVLSFPGHNLYYLEWIALVPLLSAIEGTSLRQSYLIGLTAGMVMVSGGCHWIASWALIALGIPFPLDQLVVLGFAFCTGQVFGIIALVYQWFRMQRIGSDIVLFPVVLVTALSFFPMLFYFKFGDAQSYCLPALQSIEFTGVYGLDFIIALVNILIYKTIQIPGEKFNRPLLAGCIAVLIVWFGYGIYSLSEWDRDMENWSIKRIGIVQPNRPAVLSRPKPQKGYSRVYPLEIEMSQRLTGMGAEIVFWPEGHLFGYVFWDSVQQAFRRHIKNMKVPIVFYDGTYRDIDGKRHYYNTSLWINENGQLIDQYHKMNLVPFGEYVPIVSSIGFAKKILGDFLTSLTPGTEYKTFATAGMRVVPQLCYDPLFPESVAGAIGLDAQGKVILVQSQNGWYGESNQPEMHMAITTLRAVENRVPLVHVINNGASAVVLPNGRFAFRSPPFTKGGWIAEMPYHPNRGGSFYSRHPYLFISFIRGIFILFLLLQLYQLFFSNTHSKAGDL